MVAPTVRDMILCNDWSIDPKNQNRINIFGLLGNIRAKDDVYPMIQPQLCVVLILSEVRGAGRAFIRCVLEVTDEVVFQTGDRPVEGSSDPLKVLAVPFRILGCSFQQPGLYTVQFWYNDSLVGERPLLIRSTP